MLERSNYPDDWDQYWNYCQYHNHNYHASEWCHYCQDEDEQEEQLELVHVELTAKFILFVNLYNGGEECEMTKVKGAIEAFDFAKVINWRDRTDTWGQIFEVGEKLYITITEEQAEMCEVPPKTWWEND